LKTNHQFKKKEFYLPNWGVDYLFIGTFNPSGGERVPYYYGRNKNRFWKLLSEIFEIELDPNHDKFFDNLRTLRVGCVDMIDSISYSEENEDRVLGKGYSDNVLFLSTIKKDYNTKNILDIISKNKLQKVFSTNTGGSLRKEQKLELEKIQNICEIIYLCSPSPVNPNRDNCLDDYKQKIIL
jgi:G:T/U-mismatch repair DNA glycosylase